MVPKISASASTGRHWPRVNEVNRGRAVASSTAPATHWRTATTPTGPSTGKASAAVAAPSWLDAALPVISATPVQPAGRRSVAAPAGRGGRRPRACRRGSWQEHAPARLIRKMHESTQLYALVMDLELRQLRCLVAIVDAGTFTDAAIELGISQAAVSRNLMALEQVLGVRLLHRTSRSVTPTTAGVHVLAQARQMLAAADNLVAEATTGHTTLRIGHAWSAMGRHTREFQRRWAARYPGVELHLIRTNSPTGGLAEGLCDIAVLRTAADGKRFASADRGS